MKQTTGGTNRTANLQQVKAANKGLLFSLIHHNGPLSRASLTARTKLSPTTVSTLVAELIGQGLVCELGPAETPGSGRKPILLALVPRGAIFLSAELAREYFEVAIFDLRGTELGKSREGIVDYGEVGGRLIRVAERLMANLNLDEGRLRGICIGAPALMDPERETILASTVLPIVQGNDFIPILRRRFEDAVVQLENESILSAYAEMEFGNVAGIRDLLYIDIDTGIGAGIVLDGHPYRGSSGMAGEIGHVSIDIDGPPCPCGNRGCVEQLANVPALIRMVVHMIESGGPSPHLKDFGGNACQIDFGSLCRAAEQQDPLVLEAIDEISRRLASGINSVLNVLNPQAVVIGGAMAELGDILFDRLERHLAGIALQPWAGTRRIRRSSIEGNPVTIGGARLLLDQFLALPALGRRAGTE